MVNIVVSKEHVSDLERRVRIVEQRLLVHKDLLVDHQSDASACNPNITSEDYTVEDVQEKGRTIGDESGTAGLDDFHPEYHDTDSMAMSFVDSEHVAYFGASSNITFTRYLIRSISVLWKVEAVQKPTMMGRRSSLGDMSSEKHSTCPATISTTCLPETNDFCVLPTTGEMRDMLQEYFATTGLLFPFIHQQSFMQNYEKYEKIRFSKVSRTWLSVLNMIFAMASSTGSFGQYSHEKRLARSHIFYSRGWKLCEAPSMRAPSLDIVHCLILLVLYLQGTQESNLTWTMHGLAVRSALSLGLHSEEAGQMLDEVEREVRRRTWFTCYMLDRVLSITFGRPPAIPDDFMKLEIPASWPDAALDTGIESGNDVALSSACFKCSSQLYMMMGRCLAQHYSNNLGIIELQCDDLATVSVAVRLRGELEHWRVSLPMPLGILYEPATTSGLAHPLRITLTLRYFNLMIYIHRPLLCATVRYLVMAEGATTANAPYPIQACMMESFHCVYAAERTISIVHDLATREEARQENFGLWWFKLYYVFTAALVLVTRTLWAQRRGNRASDTVADSCRTHLIKAADALHRLDRENTMVRKCRDYIRYLTQLCDVHFFELERSGKPETQPSNSERLDTASDFGLDAGAQGQQQNNTDTAQFWKTSDSEYEQLFTSELFNDSLFLDLSFAPGEHAVKFFERGH